MIHIGKVAVSILEHHVKELIGDEAIAELRQPLVEQELQNTIAEAARHAEQRWIVAYEDQEVAAVVRAMPLHDLPSVQQALRAMYDHPADPIMADVFREQLTDIIPSQFSADRVEQAIASYMDVLRTELINIPGVREKISTLANLEMVRQAARTAEELQQLNKLVAQLLAREIEVPTLETRLPQDEDKSHNFFRIVSLLRFHEARRVGRSVPFPHVSSRYDEAEALVEEGRVIYHTLVCPSPFGERHREHIIKALQRFGETRERNTSSVSKWVLIIPHDLARSSDPQEDDLTWFRGLREELELDFELEHWGHTRLLSLFKQTPTMCLYFYPELVENGAPRKHTLQDITQRYVDNLLKLYQRIEFVGMSVYKPEATRGVPMKDIYIPLAVVPAASSEDDPNIPRSNPLTLRTPGAQSVILGDPGSGKSTLLRFLTLSGFSQPLQNRYNVPQDRRLPVLIVLRRYVDELKKRANLSLIDYVQEVIQADFSLESANLDFFEYYLETGQAVLFFDGLDEQDAHYKEIIRNRIRSLVTTYPGNTVIVTSRIVGYDHPFRFDENEFTHYRVAKLQLPEIEQFVNDWYRVRIENIRERQANIDDLVNILRSEDHTAIRHLSENPLLLTIIALVHRIDAVLPDERVVLYQKCTETLLNTWHTWKFRHQEVRNRGRIERRNRRRIEAIAHWMQERMSDSEKQERAVVPYEELYGFLTKHISENEKPPDPDYDPQDLATEFLSFIKERAGLMIEVGDQQYSFVHLTFQEYLTATHISATGETGGVETIWSSIEKNYDSPNWHEVVRLLVAGLRAEETKDWLIDRILNAAGHQRNCALLSGGLLIDGIEAAELYQSEIVELLLRASIAEQDAAQLRRLTAMLRTWQHREPAHTDTIQQAFRSIWADCDAQQQYVLRLIAIILGWTEDQVCEITGCTPDASRETDLLRLFFAGPGTLETSPSLQSGLQLFWLVQQWFALTSLYLNFAAATGLSLTNALDRGVLTRQVFELMLTTIIPGITTGPYFELGRNCLLIGAKTTSSSGLSTLALNRDLTLVQDRARALDWALDRARALDWARARVLARDRALNLARTRDRALDRVRTRVLARDRALDLALDLALASDQLWRTILNSRELYEPLLELLDIVFTLHTQAQWREALRTAFLPQVPDRIAILFDQEQWKHVESAFEQQSDGQCEMYFAAWLLLIDCWLYIFEVYQTSDESIFTHLADLTRASDAPALRVAHCIRDLAYGDETREDDLVTMVQSDDPAYRTMFERCLWRPTPEEAEREAAEDTNPTFKLPGATPLKSG